MEEKLAKVGDVPIVTETSVASRQCYGCGSTDVALKVAFRVSDTQQQSMSWCEPCAMKVLDFLEVVLQGKKG